MLIASSWLLITIHQWLLVQTSAKAFPSTSLKFSVNAFQRSTVCKNIHFDGWPELFSVYTLKKGVEKLNFSTKH